MNQSTTEKGQLSAIERLHQLPALFRGPEMTVKFGWTAKQTSHYLFLWKRKGYVAPLGGHSDVFANLIVDRNPDWDRALRMAMPSAVLVGLEVLRNAGWSTQVPTRRTVAVREGGGIYSVDMFDVATRPDEWYLKVRRVLDRRGGIPSLPPAWALADIVGHSGWGACGLNPDDIDWSEITSKDQAAWGKACEALGYDLGALDEGDQMTVATGSSRKLI